MAQDTAKRKGGPDLLKAWSENVRSRHVAHGIASVRYTLLARTTSVVAAVFAAAVGTALLVSTAASENHVTRTGAGVLSLIAALLGVAQIALDYPELAARHRQAYVEYGVLRRQLDSMQAMSGDPGPTVEAIETFRVAWSRAESAAPVLSNHVRAKARRRIARSDARSRSREDSAGS